MLATWALTIGVDLFFNAGVFMPVFDQEREPSLLPDEILFRRIPVAYLALLAGVTSLAWVIDRIDLPDVRRGVILGALAGVVFSLMGVVYLWTAVEMTGVFVAAGSLVVIVEFASVGQMACHGAVADVELSPMCRLECPSAIGASTSHSRWVSLSGVSGPAWPKLCRAP